MSASIISDICMSASDICVLASIISDISMSASDICVSVSIISVNLKLTCTISIRLDGQVRKLVDFKLCPAVLPLLLSVGRLDDRKGIRSIKKSCFKIKTVNGAFECHLLLAHLVNGAVACHLLLAPFVNGALRWCHLLLAHLVNGAFECHLLRAH